MGPFIYLVVFAVVFLVGRITVGYIRGDKDNHGEDDGYGVIVFIIAILWPGALVIGIIAAIIELPRLVGKGLRSIHDKRE
jgi:hypothetical protein